MKRSIVGWTAALTMAATTATAAWGQVSIDPNAPKAIASILDWRGEEQARGFRDIEHIFKTDVVKRGKTVHRLPVADQQISPYLTIDGKGMSIDAYMAAYRVSGLLVIKNGRIVLEKYGLGRGPNDRWTSFSVAKSITSTLVGAAIQDGRIRSLNDKVTKYIPELKGSAYEGVTVRQMLMMSSGVKWNEDYTDPKSDVARAGQTVTEPGVNPMVSYLRKLPRDKPPGSTFHYNTGETDLVGVLVSKATHKSLAQYASEKIWKPYGMEQDAIWMTDPGGQDRGGCCISMTLRDYGRVGLFVLGNGKADDEQITPDWWMRDATSKQIDNDGGGYGYFWWIRPQGAYSAIGIFGQSIITFPDEKLIVVQNAAWPKATDPALSKAEFAMVDGVRAALR